jgi:hypothetical protein
MAHGDTEVTKDDVTDVTISPPVPIISTKDGDADTKLGPNSERGKSSLTSVCLSVFIICFLEHVVLQGVAILDLAY